MPVSLLTGLAASYVRAISLNGLRRLRRVADEEGATPQEAMVFASPELYEISTRFVYHMKTQNEAEIEVFVSPLSSHTSCCF